MHTNSGQTYQDRVRYYREKRENERARKHYSNFKRESINVDFDEALYQFKQPGGWQKFLRQGRSFAKGQARDHLSLYRDDERGIIGGVCAGIADKMNWDVSVVRIVTFVSGMILTVPTVVAYVAATVILRNKGLAYHGRDEKSFWKSASSTHRNEAEEITKELV